VIGRGGEAVFNLHGPTGPVELRENYGLSRRDITRIQNVLADHRADLRTAWESIHGIL